MATAPETGPSTSRSTGLSYQDLLDADSKPVPDALRRLGPPDLPVCSVPLERYTSEAFHEVEMEKVWRRVWQMACREEHIPEVGDHIIYDIGDHSIIVLRSGPETVKAYHNACLHRGRQLRDEGGRVESLTCPFHGWKWTLDGELAEIPCRWDFPDVDRDDYHLPEVKVGLWGGFVFINMDPLCESFESYIGELPEHFAVWSPEKRCITAHVAKHLPCNWKVAQEAFMEAYHVRGTHPQLLAGIGDTNSQYDVWGNVSRALTASGTPSPNMLAEVDEQEILDSMTNRSLDSPPPLTMPDGMTARALVAQTARAQLHASVPGAYDISDAELVDSIYYTLFPNFHPWGGYSKVVYRFRPFRNDPHSCVMEVFYLSPFRGKRPEPSPLRWLDFEDDWTEAIELGGLARVFNQDTFNLGKVQRGLRASVRKEVPFARYQESKIRHFYTLLEEWTARD